MREVEKGSLAKQIFVSIENFYLPQEDSNYFLRDDEVMQNMLPTIDEFLLIISQKEIQNKSPPSHFPQPTPPSRKLSLMANKNARKIQIFIRKKLTKFYNFVSSLLSTKLKTSIRSKK